MLWCPPGAGATVSRSALLHGLRPAATKACPATPSTARPTTAGGQLEARRRVRRRSRYARPRRIGLPFAPAERSASTAAEVFVRSRLPFRYQAHPSASGALFFVHTNRTHPPARRPAGAPGVWQDSPGRRVNFRADPAVLAAWSEADPLASSFAGRAPQAALSRSGERAPTSSSLCEPGFLGPWVLDRLAVVARTPAARRGPA